jgi:uncharacterized protein
MPDGDILRQITQRLAALGPVAVAFSGGVDSTLLLRLARDALGAQQVLAVTVDAAFFSRREHRESRELARALNVRQAIVAGDLLNMPEVTHNDERRCYFCKRALFGRCLAEARRRGFALLLDGSNSDDEDDYRPGQQAARELGVLSPLAEAGLTKASIRAASRALGLPTWNRPACACLASRLPYQIAITAERLGQVEHCESVLHKQGFGGSRARYLGDTVRIEIAPSEFARMLQAPVRDAVVAGCKAAGFLYVALDLEGYRTGSLNLSLRGGLTPESVRLGRQIAQIIDPPKASKNHR